MLALKRNLLNNLLSGFDKNYFVWKGLRESGKVYGMEWRECEWVCVVYKVWEWNGENVNGYVWFIRFGNGMERM